MQAVCVAAILAICVAFGHAQNLLGLATCGISIIPPHPTSRIINGQAARPNSRPYQMLLLGTHDNKTAKFYCGASIISATHVLTAAHCVDGNRPENILLFPGIHEFNNDVLSGKGGIRIRNFYRHESYNNKTLANDIAVIRLEKPLTFSDTISPICLPPLSSPVCPVGTRVVASGWGSMSGDPNRPPSSRPLELQEVVLECVDGTNSDCRSLTYTLFFMQDKSKMCAFAVNKGVCFGDSGGPLAYQRVNPDGSRSWVQYGVMSGTKDCSFTKPFPDIYANIPTLNSWIYNTVSKSA